MIDRYTKVVLSIIALALTLLAIEHGTPKAEAQIARVCSGTEEDPCYIKTTGPLEVYEPGR